MTVEFELTCLHCGCSRTCGLTQILSRLRAAGLLRRAADPSDDLVVELLQTSVGKLPCDDCDHVGLRAERVAEDDWSTVRTCQACGKPIPRERLEVFPQALRCTACEANAGASPGGEREFCSRCGEVLTMRLSRHGISRYEMRCPRCKS